MRADCSRRESEPRSTAATKLAVASCTIVRVTTMFARLPTATLPLHGAAGPDNWACRRRWSAEEVRFDLRCLECRSAAVGYLDAGIDPVKWWAGADGVFELCVSEALARTRSRA